MTSRENPILAELREEWQWIQNYKAFIEEWLRWVSSASEIRRIWPDVTARDVLFARKVIRRLTTLAGEM